MRISDWSSDVCSSDLRASEVVSLKVSDIDSARQVIRVEQGKGRKDRYAMLSHDLLELLRSWWRAGREVGVMLPGDRKSTRLNSKSLMRISYAVFCLQKKHSHSLFSPCNLFILFYLFL